MLNGRKGDNFYYIEFKSKSEDKEEEEEEEEWNNGMLERSTYMEHILRGSNILTLLLRIVLLVITWMIWKRSRSIDQDIEILRERL